MGSENLKNIAAEETYMNFITLITPLDSSLSGTLISCVTCLGYIENFPMKNANKLNYYCEGTE